MKLLLAFVALLGTIALVQANGGYGPIPNDDPHLKEDLKILFPKIQETLPGAVGPVEVKKAELQIVNAENRNYRATIEVLGNKTAWVCQIEIHCCPHGDEKVQQPPKITKLSCPPL